MGISETERGAVDTAACNAAEHGDVFSGNNRMWHPCDQADVLRQNFINQQRRETTLFLSHAAFEDVGFTCLLERSAKLYLSSEQTTASLR